MFDTPTPETLSLVSALRSWAVGFGVIKPDSYSPNCTGNRFGKSHKPVIPTDRAWGLPRHVGQNFYPCTVKWKKSENVPSLFFKAKPFPFYRASLYSKMAFPTFLSVNVSFMNDDICSLTSFFDKVGSCPTHVGSSFFFNVTHPEH